MFKLEEIAWDTADDTWNTKGGKIDSKSSRFIKCLLLKKF